jgi:hypothetical protein
VKKIIIFTLIAALACMMLTGCQFAADGDADTVGNADYNGITYERTDFPNYNLVLLKETAQYIGDYIETYNYGYQIPWEVYVLNDEANILFSAHAIWIKPGYVFPDEYGEEFTCAEYVVSEGILDEYQEEVKPLVTFEDGVTLADIIESDASEISDYTQYADIRFRYKNHADMAVLFALCEWNGQYYLNVCEDTTGNAVWFRIKTEYTDVLTSAVAKMQPTE